MRWLSAANTSCRDCRGWRVYEPVYSGVCPNLGDTKRNNLGPLKFGKKNGEYTILFFCLIRKIILIGRNLVFHIPMWLSQAPTSSCLGRSGGPFCCSSTKDIFSTVDFAAAQSMQHAQNGHSISGLLTS